MQRLRLASTDGLANGSSLKRPAAPRTCMQGRRKLGARGLGEPGRGITPHDKSITLFLKFILIAKVSKSYCFSVLQDSLLTYKCLKFTILFIDRFCDPCQYEFPVVMEKISYPSRASTLANFLYNLVEFVFASHNTDL